MMKRNILIGLLIFVMGLFAAPVLFAQAEDDEGDEVQSEIPKYGQDSASCVMNLSLYREFYKQWKKSNEKGNTIKDAIKPWKYVFYNCPRATKNIYIDGANILEYMINETESKEKKNNLIDTLMLLYDKRIKYYDQEGYVRGKQGYDLYRLRTSDFDQAYQYFKTSVEKQGNEAQPAILVYYFRTTIKMATTNKIDSARIVEVYDQISEIIDNNIEKDESMGKSAESWINIKGNVDVTFEPFATCKDLVKIFSKKFEKKPDDIETLKKITNKLDEHKCNESELFFKASLKLYELEPSPNSALMIGKMYINKKDYRKALDYLQEATDLEDEDERADAYYFMAFCYQQIDNYQQARAAARKAIEFKPDYGNAYILIGDLYAASSEQCATDDLSKKVVYLLAVDKYYKAKQVDPDVTDIANERIKAYTQYFPRKETIFFHDYNVGDSYKLGCWINESTVLRSSD
ncbi:MAG: hypothetical protein K9G45_07240 [Bacteroidales bacterium]|nr:hypothetical protein [Bacteroidales bacterium]MCF8401144.1 hypothetical protein [Bacteroidales bacterium]